MTPSPSRPEAVQRRPVEVRIHAHLATAAGPPAPVDDHPPFAAAATTGALSDDLARGLAPSTGLRNRLVHEHGEVD